MPAYGAIEGEGYRTHTFYGQYTGKQRDLQQVIKKTGEEANYWTKLNAQPGQVDPDATVNEFVGAEYLVIKDGYKIDVLGNKEQIKNEIQVVIGPQHAHGGCYTYAPVAAKYAEFLKQKELPGLTFNKKG